MNDRILGYVNAEAPEPPALSEGRVVWEIGRRERRASLLLLSVGELLWTALLGAICFWVSLESRAAGLLLLAATAGGYALAGIFAGAVLLHRKAGR